MERALSYVVLLLAIAVTEKECSSQGVAKALINGTPLGTSEHEVGDLVILDSSGSVGGAFKWILVNSTKTFLPVENGRKAVFASGKAGTYIFVLVVGSGDNNNRLTIDMARHNVIITGGTPVVPIDPIDPVDPPPTTKPKKVTFVYEQSEQIVPREFQAVLRSLNSKGISATAIDDDGMTGLEAIPQQYKDAVKAARDNGTPCLVIEYVDRIQTIVDPKLADLQALDK